MARTKKSLRKIQGLIFLMLITLVFGITATYAWFSTQRDVEIAGMRLNVEVAESMQISLDGEKWTQSIQIADMRQFYGTYDVSGDEGFAVFQAKDIDEGGNLNYVPTELKPVSTAGEVAGGKLQFVQGTIGTNADGSQSLTGITACTETDITNTATIANKEANNEEHPYLVFDMYLRNISAKTKGTDELLLNAGSSVYINTGTSDDGEQEGKGVYGTGLEYSTRVGFIIYGNTVSVTAEDDADLGSVGEQIRGINPNNSEIAAIWEPNSYNHTQYVVNNNGRGITDTSQLVTTYGIKSSVASSVDKEVVNVNANIDENDDGLEDTNANLVAVKTFKPSYRTGDSGIYNKTVITNTAGNSIGLAANQISKVRVYIWLEGQDPDCIDMASTGDKLNINLKLTKETNTVTENTYQGQYIEPSEYGAYVTNYVPTNGVNDEGTKWRIFYADGENTYLIADSYVPRTNEAENKNYVPTGYTNTSGEYGFNLLAAQPYAGSSAVDSDIANKWLKKYTTLGYTATNIKVNGRTTAFLLDTVAWSGFKDDTYAEYAVGAPTIELFAASYNKTHPSRILETKAVEVGYSLKMSDQNEWKHTLDRIDTNESLYVITDTFDSTIEGVWLASPSSYKNDGTLAVEMRGLVGAVGPAAKVFGVRPIICLKNTVKLEKQADGNYKLVQ